MYLLDTNVISELRKVKTGRANPRVKAWAETVQATTQYLSAVTVLELEVGILLKERHDPAQAALLRSWMNNQVLPGFAGRILPVDTAVAQRCARFHVPNPLPEIDAMIAATALVHGMTVVTRNVADFISTGVAVFNPWLD